MRRRRLLISVVLLGVGASAGCYEHVVGAKGYGAAGTDVYEPNIKDQGKSQKTPMQRKPPSRMRSDG